MFAAVGEESGLGARGCFPTIQWGTHFSSAYPFSFFYFFLILILHNDVWNIGSYSLLKVWRF